ncbi:cation:proton antiporter [uncultured Bradyrhizobium sp.]|uniref:cation:proton antiporter n=1 Tax=uncultured Bradyrhizobium sp. TaxID=199684 RepID=UPI0035CB10B2
MLQRTPVRYPVIPVYVISLAAGAASLWLIARAGERLYGGVPPIVVGHAVTAFEAMTHELYKHINSPIGNVILQILVILILSRIFGTALRRIGQPQVMGEIFAGIFLGPSVLKTVLPEAHKFLFPESSVSQLFILSNIGLVLFMFTLGLELNRHALSIRKSSALLVSHISIIFPFVLGAALALLLFDTYASAKYGFVPFALFMGICMSITAFPVLARIVQEFELTTTTVGIVAIAAAAIDDATAWCILAIVVGIVQAGSGVGASLILLFAALYCAVAVLAVRPALSKYLPQSLPGSRQMPPATVAIALIVLLGSCFLTQLIGLHALFGAFMAGVIMPEQENFKERLLARVQDVSTLFLVPLFFAFTGLRAEIGLLNDLQSWGVCALIILVAIAGKLGGSLAAARWSGLGWRESFGLGALMNTRGLVELVVLNIGYDLGILPPKIFAMLVIMAIFTTMMTGPLLLILKLSPQPARLAEHKQVVRPDI